MANSAQIKQGEQTRKQILVFIARYQKKNGMSPSLQEIAAGVGLASHNAVREHMLKLRDAKKLTWTEGKMRSFKLIVPKVPKTP